MNIKTIVANGILAALYIAVTATIAPLGFGQLQFRISEMFNHLIVFNKKYIYGIVLGVFLSNLFFSPMVAYDIVFGTAQSLIALLITIGAMRYVKNIWARMMINTVVFTFTMFMIAWELHLALGFPFLLTWLTTAAGEFAVLLVGAPIIYAINKRVNFQKLI
ncbi:QueT transporter family protein [Bacillus sp. V59.32b]|uniref:QueT transporter family protein n=1 Tax=Bacillus sp. V59.32b TaxID=1758642 RepID=UPI000E3C5495|nr:QueT transporter family protein [Bacillus sp. V59.32b]RFU63599.1 QueT transporter family protein [Bacillus sp. V59.32b]